MTRTPPDHTTHRPDAPQTRLDHQRTLTAAALRAAAAGWAVFPVRPRGKTPAVRGWEDVATLDRDRILAWWAGTAWNIGVATGPSGLLVVDLDVPTTTDPDSVAGHTVAAAARGLPAPDAGRNLAVEVDEAVTGAALLRELADTTGAPPWDTFTVATPSGGRHLYFRQPDGVGLRNTQGTLGPLIDTRGHGGYVLAPGSRGSGTRRYWIVRDAPVAELPAWLHDALTTPTPPAGTNDAALDRSDAVSGKTGNPMPQVSGARVEAYLRAVVDGETRAVTAAHVGTRHTTLLRAARRLGHWVGSGALTTAAARAALTTAASGYIGVDGYTTAQVERDITDGLAYGAARPRHIDDLPDRPTANPSDTGK